MRVLTSLSAFAVLAYQTLLYFLIFEMIFFQSNLFSEIRNLNSARTQANFQFMFSIIEST